MAKLRLLERGLVDAALGVDDLQLQSKPSKGKGKAEEEGEDVEMDGGDDDTPDETPEQFMSRINLYVAIHLSRTKNTRDDYKNETAYQMRKDIIQDFLRSSILKKCQNADCYSYVLLLRSNFRYSMQS
jgi:DNA-directed RNA polymerase I subunit RPA1